MRGAEWGFASGGALSICVCLVLRGDCVACFGKGGTLSAHVSARLLDIPAVVQRDGILKVMGARLVGYLRVDDRLLRRLESPL